MQQFKSEIRLGLNVKDLNFSPSTSSDWWIEEVMLAHEFFINPGALKAQREIFFEIFNRPDDTVAFVRTMKHPLAVFALKRPTGEYLAFCQINAEAQDGELHNVVVQSKMKKQGLGTAVVKASLRWAATQGKKFGLETISLRTLREWPHINFFQKLGFRPITYDTSIIKRTLD